ncbi:MULTISPECIES: DNA damage response protein DdrC [unclassified Meiothermus]|uniref:DNA damage response protein DdrC n=1 Tax=unclassified Meiothermus TaxID=370471 RepID=UPI0018F271C1|nr:MULTISPECIES: DNA damage response protein DdrC [unclassified Meiothermus]
MKNALVENPKSAIRLGPASIRTSPDGRLSALDSLAALGLKPDLKQLDLLVREHSLPMGQHDFGHGREPAFSYAEFVQLVFALETPQAQRLRSKARDLFRRYLEGDVGLAAEIAERSPSAEHRRWLSARLESIESRKRFMATIAKHGGQGDIFRQVSSLSNRSVLKMSAADFRRKRRVKNTRDGMSAAELLRLSYLESATARLIEKRKVQGNEQILKLHRENSEIERKLWEE